MPDGGTIEVHTALDTDHAVLTIRDTGHGMPADVAARALDPFFSTKPRGQGTGLGLPTIKSITERANGTVQLTSTPGVGTTLAVRIPLAVPTPRLNTGTREPEPALVLVLVEFRHLTCRMLKDNGYPTIETGDASVALEILDQIPVGVLLTDIRMPGVGGFELARSASMKQSDLRVVFMSGFHDQHPCESDLGVLLRKPFTELDLVTAISRARCGAAAPSPAPRGA